MLNVTRYTKGKHGLTSSEEERANGKRKKTSNKLFKDSDCADVDDNFESSSAEEDERSPNKVAEQVLTGEDHEPPPNKIAEQVPPGESIPTTPAVLSHAVLVSNVLHLSSIWLAPL